MFRVVVAALVAALMHGAAWVVAHRSVTPPDVGDAFASLSFTPFAPEQDKPEKRERNIARIDRDLERVAEVTSTIRTYSSSGIMEVVPGLARKHGLAVTLGAWVGVTEDFTRREIQNAIDLARSNSNVRSIIVGNEVVLRAERTVDEMIAYLRHVKKRVRVPVSTGEVWNIWLENPRLVNEVDFIAVHILPYWEGVPAEATVDYTLMRYRQLREKYPGKKIVIAEFGWPSQGYNRKGADAGQLEQAAVIRSFLAEAAKQSVDYNIIEAFDQPWKTDEGSVGPYWGIFDAKREPKFSLAGHEERRHHWALTAVALAAGAALTFVGLRRRRPTFGHALLFAAAANAMGAGLAAAGAYPFQNYLNFGTAVMWIVGFGLMLPLVVITLGKVHEIAEVVLGRRPQRLIPVALKTADDRLPKVSIHIPAYREQPDMLKATLDSVATLDYPDFEALVVINNTPEEQYWKPIEEHCRKLGERFKFVYLPKVAGFKAGALNLAMERMASDAEIIALIDADYVVHRDWLKDLVPAFADPRVGLVQAPQDHRDGNRSLLKTMMNAEYAGFFDIGMVQRNEDDAIIAHGTMLLVRRSAFEQVGGWATDTITEDTELGLRLFEAGYTAHYTNRRYGWGVLPDTFKAFKTQRERWAYGAVQIIKKHWPHFLPGVRTLTSPQKFQFVTGWMYWLSDAFGVVMAILALLWAPVILLVGTTIPTVALTVPVLTAFAVNILHCVLLYRARVKTGFFSVIGAAVAAMSLQLTVANAVLRGFVKDNLPFNRTDKGGNARKKKSDRPVRWEAVLGIALLATAWALWRFNQHGIAEQKLFAVTLAVQSVPFLAALLMRGIELGEDRVRALLARRRAATPAPSAPVATAVPVSVTQAEVARAA
jgi:cellulose synthase/poly-beta-1,6-N-acetylglucosamine synthase-like glycosyltransferase/exo-beta-1,3-glucanase (GH17 family)